MKLPKTRAELERFVQIKGMRAVGVAEHQGRSIYLAETDLETNKPMEYPWGYYQTAWFIEGKNEAFDVGSWIEFDSMHDKDKEWTPETKRQMRENAALQEAMKWIDRNKDNGRYG